MKLSVFEISDKDRSGFNALEGDRFQITFSEEPLTEENAREYADSDIVCVSIYSRLNAEVLGIFRELKFVSTRSTGYDQIDIEYCRQHNIAVSNVPMYAERTVAEHVFALILAIGHKIVESVDRTRRGDFSQKALRGFDLDGKTLGVLGTGNIGQNVIEIAKGFRMKVLAYDVYPRTELESRLGFEYASLEEVLSGSDVITLHIPSTPKTYHFMSGEQFSKMKDGAVIINTARGELVDTPALLKALGEGKIRAAGLDVLEDEPVIREETELLSAIFQKEHDLETLLAENILLRLRNVLITPHNAFNTREAIQRIFDVSVANIRDFLAGRPRNLVTPAPQVAAR